jgi:hypothetical protein
VSKSDRRKMRGMSLVFLVGFVTIRAGLAQRSENVQLVGELSASSASPGPRSADGG